MLCLKIRVSPLCVSQSPRIGDVQVLVPKSGCGARGFGMQKENRGRFQWVGGWINEWMYTHTRSMYRLVRFSMLNFLNSGAVCV